MMRAHIYIMGRVHGVGFRSNARRRASQMYLAGWVRNLLDGRVEAVAEGPEEDVEKFIQWCRRGPTMAHVTDIKVMRLPATGEFQGFRVKR